MSEAASMTAVLLLQGAPEPSFFTPILLMALIFYLVLFLPMRRRQRKHEAMLGALKNGDIVATNGGLVGTVVGLTEKTVTLRVKPDNVKLEFARAAVSGIAEEQAEE